jgi:hypothetical protein
VVIVRYVLGPETLPDQQAGTAEREPAMTTRPSWPSGPADEYYADDNRALLNRARPDQRPAQEVIGVMAGLLRDTRGNMLLSGIVLGAATIGIALETAFSGRPVRPDAAGVVNAALLCGLLLCWLRAVILLALAGRPALNTLSELRWRTGAPLDPRARWLTLPPADTSPEEWAWTRAHLLLAAARLARYRTQLADTWAFITATYFLVWTATVFLGL